VITFVIPTRNRPDFLRRVLAYYRRTGATYPLLVADSSDGPPPADVLPLLAEPPVRHLVFPPETRFHAKILQALREVETPCVCLWADDDFMVPDCAAAGAALLARDASYSAAAGRSIHFTLYDEGRVLRVWPYEQRAWEEPDVERRLVSYFENYTTVFYAVQRTASQLRRFQQLSEANLDYWWGELVLAADTLIEGRVHLDPRLGMVRESHEQQSSAEAWNVFSWISTGTYGAGFPKVRALLQESLVRDHGRDPARAAALVDQALWAFLRHGLATDYDARYRPAVAAPPAPGVGARLSAGLRKGPLWRLAAWAERGAGDGEWSVEALTSGRSPHARAFAPIFAALTGDRSTRAG
jgi:glycosyltransferase domain-containing protein